MKSADTIIGDVGCLALGVASGDIMSEIPAIVSLIKDLTAKSGYNDEQIDTVIRNMSGDDVKRLLSMEPSGIMQYLANAVDTRTN